MFGWSIFFTWCEDISRRRVVSPIQISVWLCVCSNKDGPFPRGEMSFRLCTNLLRFFLSRYKYSWLFKKLKTNRAHSNYTTQGNKEENFIFPLLQIKKSKFIKSWRLTMAITSNKCWLENRLCQTKNNLGASEKPNQKWGKSKSENRRDPQLTLPVYRV